MKKRFLVLAAAGVLMSTSAFAGVKSVVLVHGAFVDGSTWKPVANILERDGYTVHVVQAPLTSLDADVEATRLVLDRAGPSVLVGHSWGGMVISDAGNHPSARSLVYVAAFQPIAGESAGALQAQAPPAAQSVVPVGGGFLQVNPDLFHQDVAQDLPERAVHFASISQSPIAGASFGSAAGSPAWLSKPSYAVVATEDREIDPELERFMGRRANSETIEIKASHAVYISHPREVAALIEKAAQASD